MAIRFFPKGLIFRRTILVIAGLLAFAARSASAASFSVAAGATDTAAKTLASGQTGSVASTGSLAVAGGNVAVTVTGNATINNSGALKQTGTAGAAGRGIDLNTAGVTLAITNNSTGLIQTADGDAIRVNKGSAGITLDNYGAITSLNASGGGSQALDWNAISSGTNILRNYAGAVISATAADAIRPGVNGIVTNAGVITATPVADTTTPEVDVTSSDGVDAQSNSGIVITNSGSISGRHGVTGGDAALNNFNLTVNNQSGATISGVNGSGINIDGVFSGVVVNVTNASGGTIRGGVLGAASSAAGDGDGVDVDGVVNLNNSGDILGYGARGSGSDGGENNAEAVSVGGGTIINSATGRIVGSSLAADAPNGDVTREGHGILVDNSSGGNAVAVANIINDGLIQGKTGYAIKIVGSYDNTITNNAGGVIRGAGTGAAIQLGAGSDTVVNRGAITGDNGQAVDLGLGANQFRIEGGAASINGDVSGGVGSTSKLTVDPGLNNTFNYTGRFSNFNNVEIKSGTVKLSGASSYVGNTVISGGTLFARNSTGSATGTGSVTIKNLAALAGDGRIGGDVLVEAGGRIAPGDGVGTLKIGGNLTLADASRFLFELGANAVSSDFLAIEGNLSFSGPGQVLFDFTNLGVGVGTYTLLSYGSASGLSLANLAIGQHDGFTGNLILDSNSVSLVVTAIPEPSITASVLGLLVFAGALKHRSRTRRSVV